MEADPAPIIGEPSRAVTALMPVVSTQLKLYPPEIEFYAIEPEILHVVRVVATNLDSVPHRIRVKHPKTKEFRLIDNPDVAIAPGLDMYFELEFFTTEEGQEFSDTLIVATEDEEIEIPIRATLPKSRIHFDGHVNLGVAVANQSAFGYVQLANEGECAGSFDFKWDESLPIKITPSSGKLEEAGHPNDHTTIKVEFFGGTLGLFRALAMIEFQHQASRALDVCANVVEQTMVCSFKDSGLEVQELDFGAVYYGRPGTIPLILFNNGPNPASFSLTSEEKEEASSSDSYFVLEPSQGLLQPFESREVLATFDPKQDVARTGFINQNEAEAPSEPFPSTACKQLEVLETSQQVRLPMTGVAYKPEVHLDQNVISFGSCRVYEKKDVLVRIKNRNPELPMEFRVPKVANFRVDPIKCVLQPLAARTLAVTFFPQQLGSVHNRLEFIFEQGALKIPVKVSGHAESAQGVFDKKCVVAGIDKTDADFKRDLDIVPSDSRKKKTPKYRRPNPVDVYMKDDQTGFVNEFTLTVPQERQRQEHRAQYDNYIKSQHKSRSKITEAAPKLLNHEEPKTELFEKIAQMEENQRAQDSGLRSPRLELPAPDTEVWLLKGPGQAGGGGSRRDATVFDQDKIFKRKFKPNPVSSNECRDCKQVLSADDLLSIESGPKTVDFGTTCCYGAVTKSFALHNTLQQFILVQISAESDELKQSSPRSQVIPPGGTAGFNIVLCSDKTGSIRKAVGFTINDHHSNRFNVVANVVPLNLQVEQTEIPFRFADTNLGMCTTEVVRLTNPWPHKAEFEVEADSNEPFTPATLSGVVPPNGTIEFPITFTPPLSDKAQNHQEKFVLNVAGGPPIIVNCSADFTPPKLELPTPEIDLDCISVGAKAEFSFLIKNTGKSNAVFGIVASSSVFELTTNKGLIRPGQKAEIVGTIRLTDACTINETLSIMLRGGKPLVIKIRAEASLPKIAFEEAEFDFHEVTVGDYEALTGHLKNTGRLPCTLFIDLSEHEGFAIQSHPDPLDPTVFTECPIKIVQSMDEDDRPGTAMSVATDGSAMGDALMPSIYRIDLPRGATLPLNFVFAPMNVKDYAFELPLQFSGMKPGSNPIVDRYVMAGKGLKPRLKLSHKVAEFGSKVIIKDRTKKAPYHVDVVISNEDFKDIEWFMDTSSMPNTTGAEPLWVVEPSSGLLGPADTKSIRICFYPESDESFEFMMPIFVDGNQDKRYLELVVKGAGRHPMILFSEQEVMLPVVPLGVESTAEFLVINSGHDQLLLQHKLPADTDRLPLKLEFPEGQQIGMGKDQIRVLVSFVSDKPISFTARVDFFDADCNRFSIRVTGTTDNSLCTMYPYLISHPIGEESELRVQGNAETGAVILTENSKKALPLLGEQEEEDGDENVQVMSLESPEAEEKAKLAANQAKMQALPPHVQHGLAFMLRWLNQFVPTASFQSIPDDFWNSKGKLLFEVIEALSGKNVPGRVPKLSSNKKEAIQQLIQQYEDALSFLKSHGALLNHVKPENLLLPGEHEQFCRLNIPLIVDKNEGIPGHSAPAKKRKFSARRYVRITVEAWLDVLYQVSKVFMLGRVSVKQFRAMPGIPKKETEKMGLSITGSNIYSVPENLILKWLSFHYNKTFPTMPRRVTNLETDLTDGLVIAALLISHAPYINKGGRVRQSLITNVESRGDRLANLGKVIQLMNELALGMAMTVNDLIEPVARDLILNCLFLYQTLPHYIPKTTVEFTGRLGEQIIKNIELANSSKATITYSARLEGSPDFKLLQSVIRVEPKSKQPFGIEFIGKFSHVVEATLFLIPERDGGSVGSPLVFYLQSAITELKPCAHHTIESKTYEATTMNISVTNPFKNDCVFNLSSNQMFLDARQVEEAVKRAPPDTNRNKAPGTPPPEPAAPAKKGKKGNNAKKPNFLPDERIVEFFHFKERELAIKAGQTVEVAMCFLPFSPGMHSCELMLLDEASGELMVQVHGVASLPMLVDTVSMQCEKGSTIIKDTPVGFNNPLREAALSLLEKEFGFTPPASVADTVLLKVESSHAAFTIGTHVALQPAGAAVMEVKEGIMLGQISATFAPREVMQYQTEIVLHRPGDIRRYKLLGAGKSAGTEAALNFNAPAREVTQQLIPIDNGSDKPWTINAEFVGDRCFSGPSSLSVPPFQRGLYPLEFVPAWIGESASKLTLVNTTVDDRYVYNLRGVGEDPLASQHVSVECRVWDKHEMKFPIPIMGSGGEITVESDLPYISGPGTITLEQGQPGECTLTVCPKLSGIYSGSVTFTCPSVTEGDQPEYTWSTIEVVASPGEPVQSLEISTQLRKVIGLDIPIRNPISKPIEFEVRIAGDGLLGERFLRLGPSESSVYELIYSPLKPGVGDGAITFANVEAGEFWYKINLEALKPSPVVLPPMECEIGKSIEVEFLIENPISEHVDLTAFNTNSANFELLDDDQLGLEPFGALSLRLKYTASSVGHEQTGSLSLRHPKVADWEFTLSGVGLPPTEMAVTDFYAPLGQTTSDPIALRNPFEHSIDVVVSLEGLNPTSQAFRLIGASGSGEKKMTLSRYQTVQIPIRFAPGNLDDCQANVVVSESSTGTRWTYPVAGKVFVDTEVAQSLYYSCAARTSLEETMEILLPGLKASDGAVPITFEMQFAPEDEKMLSRALSLEPLTGELMARHDAPLQFKLGFEPLRPLSTIVKLLIQRANGGQWTFDLEIESTDPEIDDTIVISSLLNQTSSVAFNLTNQFTTYTPFKAYFTPDSSLAFAVEPKSGLLEPYGTTGTNFVVSYTAQAYGKMDIGKLVILTEEMQWSYEVRGTLPQYQIPEGSPKVATRLAPTVEGELERLKRKPRKNYLRDQAKRPAGRN